MLYLSYHPKYIRISSLIVFHLLYIDWLYQKGWVKYKIKVAPTCLQKTDLSPALQEQLYLYFLMGLVLLFPLVLGGDMTTI